MITIETLTLKVKTNLQNIRERKKRTIIDSDLVQLSKIETQLKRILRLLKIMVKFRTSLNHIENEN